MFLRAYKVILHQKGALPEGGAVSSSAKVMRVSAADAAFITGLGYSGEAFGGAKEVWLEDFVKESGRGPELPVSELIVARGAQAV